jgi:hypothetical protein
MEGNHAHLFFQLSLNRATRHSVNLLFRARTCEAHHNLTLVTRPASRTLTHDSPGELKHLVRGLTRDRPQRAGVNQRSEGHSN